MNNIGKEDNITFLRKERFKQGISNRKFPFKFKITDIEGGEVLSPEPYLQLVLDSPEPPRSGFLSRLIMSIDRKTNQMFNQFKNSPSADLDHQSEWNLLARLVAKRGMKL